MLTDTRVAVETKTVDGATLSPSDFAYVPDPASPSTWKLRIDDAAHVGGAAAALGPGFRGQKVTIPAGDLGKVKAKVRAAWKKFHPDQSEDEMPESIKAAEPDTTDVHVNAAGVATSKTTTPTQVPGQQAAPARKTIKVDNPHFTNKLGDILKDHVHPDVFKSAVVIARAHAGGKVRAEKMAQQKADEQAKKDQEEADARGDVAESDDPNMQEADAQPKVGRGAKVAASDESFTMAYPAWADDDQWEDEDDDEDEGDGDTDNDDPPLKEKTAVNYRPAKEVGVQCGTCLFFDADDGCTLVEGRIAASMLCDLFEPATMANREAPAVILPTMVTTPAGRRTGDIAHLCASAAPSSSWGESSPGAWRLFVNAGKLFADTAGPPTWIPYLPKPGTYSHPRWGEMTITPERNARFIKNFNDRIYQYPIPLDAEHETKLSGAVAWIYAMRSNSDGSVDAKVEWTERGKAFMEQGAFKFVSPEWFEEWRQPDTGTMFTDVAIGGAITTRPYFKERSLRPLVASEAGLSVGRAVKDGDRWTLGFTTLRPVAARGVTEKETTMPPTTGTTTPPTTGTTATGAAPANVTTENPSGTMTFAEYDAKIRELTEKNAKIEADARTAAERVARLENDARHKRFGEIVTGASRPDGHPWMGDRETQVTRLEKLADAWGEDSADFKDYVKDQNATAEQIAASTLFRELGRDGSVLTDGTGSATVKADALAKQYREADPKLTEAKARAKVWADNPGLYADYEKEQARRARR